MKIKITLPGSIRSKKNSKTICMIGGVNVPKRPMIMSSKAYNFYCDKNLHEIQKILNEVGPYQWEVWDSHWYGDYLRANNEESVKIKIFEPPDQAGPPFTLQIQGNVTKELQAELTENRKKWYKVLGVTKTKKGEIFD